ncbi:MAG: hypothetical protein EP341_00375 [Sphingomonadales bacterium]|nr:MAG: hypothetical protein EP341_00375 [Sphingomonadales bacterium]
MLTDEFVKFAGVCRQNLSSMGCVPVIKQDFDECEQIAKELGKEKLSSLMSPSMHDFTEGTCFWLFIYKDGMPVAAVASKREQLGDEAIGNYWRRANARQYGVEHTCDVSVLATEHLHGDVAYIGELFVKKGERGKRELLRAAMHYLHAIIFLEWKVEYSYAFIRDRDVRVGMAAEYGFSRQHFSPQIWAPEPDGRMNSEWLVSSSRRDFLHVARRLTRSDDSA